MKARTKFLIKLRIKAILFFIYVFRKMITKPLFNLRYVGGKPILINGRYHIEWQCRKGGASITKYGWADKASAEQFIANLMKMPIIITSY